MNAQENTHTYPINFQMEEYSEIIDTDFNKTSIDFSLPSSDWNMTDFQINFSNITSNIQTKVIDGGINSWDVIELSSDKFSLAVRLNWPIRLLYMLLKFLATLLHPLLVKFMFKYKDVIRGVVFQIRQFMALLYY